MTSNINELEIHAEQCEAELTVKSLNDSLSLIDKYDF